MQPRHPAGRSGPPRAAASLIAALITLTGCEEMAAPSAMPTPTPTPVVLTPPRLVAPAPGAVILQNDPATGCEPYPDRGYGYQITFEWAPGEGSVGIQSYRLLMYRPSARFSVIDQVVDVPHYLHRGCGAYVAPFNLDGWVWRVQALGVDGSIGPWSETGTFDFAPCMLNRRSFCGG